MRRRRTSVLVLYTHPLFGQVIKQLLAGEAWLRVAAVAAVDADAVEQALASAPDMVIVEEGVRLDLQLLRDLAPRTLVIDLSVDASGARRPRPGAVAANPETLVDVIRAHGPRRGSSARRPRSWPPPVVAAEARYEPQVIERALGDGHAAAHRPGVAPEVRRRRFLTTGIVAIAGYIATLVGAPALVYVLSPALRRSGEKKWIAVGSASDLKVDSPKKAEFTVSRRDGWIERTDRQSAWLVRRDDGSLLAFSPRCTHLGCAYDWKPDEKRFVCPCHTGVFAIDGAVQGGPPPRPLDRYPVRKRADGVVEVQLL